MRFCIRKFTLLPFLALFVGLLPLQAKNVVVTYDISMSMFKMGQQNFMSSEDIRRVNEYLTAMLFDNVSTDATSSKDDMIAIYKGPYVGQPFYKEGDKLTLILFHEHRIYKIKLNPNAKKEQFLGALPDHRNLRDSFSGMNTLIGKTKAEIYRDLYSHGEETYWINVSDEDEDIPDTEFKDPDLLKELAYIEETYEEELVSKVMFNRHVILSVLSLGTKRTFSDAVFITQKGSSGKQLEKVRILREAGGFRSERLVIDTSHPEKGDFFLEMLNVALLDANGESVSTLEQQSLQGSAPPYEFDITFPEGIKEQPTGTLSLEVKYKALNEPKMSPAFTVEYEIEFNTLNLFTAQKPLVRPESIIFTEKDGGGFISEMLLADTQAPRKTDFHLEELHCQISISEGQILFDKLLPLHSNNPGDNFQIELPGDQTALERADARLRLELRYRYKDQNKTAVLEDLPYKFKRGFPPGVLSFVLFVLVLLLIAGMVLWIRNHLAKRHTNSELSLNIQKTNENDMPLGDSSDFVLAHGNILSFDPTRQGDIFFDLDCPGYLNCYQGALYYYKDDDDKGRELTNGQVIAMTNNSGGNVYVRIKIYAAEDEELDAGESSRDEESRSEPGGVLDF